jgi:hypothetical protein
VIRSWITAANAYPRWITDAVAVTTEPSSRLVLDQKDSSYYLERTKDHYPLKTNKALRSAGMQIGTGGLFGSCWSDREGYIFVFEPRPK